MQESIDGAESDLPVSRCESTQKGGCVYEVSHSYHMELECPQEARVLKRGPLMTVLRDFMKHLEVTASGGGQLVGSHALQGLRACGPPPFFFLPVCHQWLCSPHSPLHHCLPQYRPESDRGK